MYQFHGYVPENFPPVERTGQPMPDWFSTGYHCINMETVRYVDLVNNRGTIQLRFHFVKDSRPLVIDESHPRFKEICKLFLLVVPK